MIRMTRINAGIASLLFVFVACSSEQTKSAQHDSMNAVDDVQTNTDESSEADQASAWKNNTVFSAEQCAESGGRAIIGLPYDASKGCHDLAEAAGCIPAGQGCGEAFTYARDSSGKTWEFSDNCIPEGWQPFQAGNSDWAAVKGPLCSDLSKPEEPNPNAECSALSLQDCSKTNHCMNVYATKYDVSQNCRYFSEPHLAGCIKKQDCDLAVTFAQAPSGETWRFNDSCIPEGWQRFQESEEDRAAADGPVCFDTDAKCAEFPADQCVSKGCQPIIGLPYDVDKGCHSSAEAVGCMAADKACADAYHFAKDTAGSKWMFANGCIPEGWEAIPPTPSSPEASAPGWPLCEE